MEGNEWKDWEGKKCFIKTIDGTIYNCEVMNVDILNYFDIFLTIKDKFGLKVKLKPKEISVIREEK